MMSAEFEVPLVSAIREGRWDAAYDEARRWSEQPDCGPVPFFVLNVVCMLRGDFAEAWKVYPHALGEEANVQIVRDWATGLCEQFPDAPSLVLMEGVFHTQSGRLDDAMERYQRVITLAPDSPYPHFFLAQIHQRMERPDQGIKAYREAVKRDPNYVAARLNLGVAYQEQGQLEMAIPQYREALKLRPEEMMAHTNLACALAEQGKIEAAIEEYKKALKKYNHFFISLLFL